MAYTTRSRLTACAPVPLRGQSSGLCPARVSVAAKASLSLRANVLNSATMQAWVPAAAISAATVPSAAGVGRLSRMRGASRVKAPTSGSNLDPRRGQFGAAPRVHVGAENPPAALDEVASDGAAHDPEPDRCRLSARCALPVRRLDCRRLS